MKKLLLLTLCLMLLLVGCNSAESDNSMPESSSASFGESSQSGESSTPSENSSQITQEELEFEAMKLRIGYTEEMPSPSIIKTQKELTDYFDKNERILASLTKYDDEFFKAKQIIVLPYFEGSGSISHEVKKLTYDGENLYIEVLRTSPEMQTDDIAVWRILIEIKADITLESPEAIKVDTYTMPNESVKTALSTFALSLFKDVVSNGDDGNVLVSPLSVQLALAMTANGAQGDTKREMETLLSGEFGMDELNNLNKHYLGWLPNDDGARLHIANSIWVRNNGSIKVKDDFLRINKDFYKSILFKKPFNDETVKDINEWVEENTDGMIDQIIEEIDDNTVMYLINALAFEAEWRNIYTEEQIYDGNFTSADGKTKSVPMMHSEEERYFETENATGFFKNYKGNRFSFVAVLPNKELSVDEYINSLDEKELAKILYAPKRDFCETVMPKFTSETSLSLNETLKRLGMPTAFKSGMADFTAMGESPQGNLYIGSVLHKTFIQVDERGTKAGAVTSVQMDAEGAIEGLKRVVLDRPFVYMIVDYELGMPIFIGVQKNID